MRQAEHPDLSDDPVEFRCPLCGTREDKPVFRVPLSWAHDGEVGRTLQVHVDCLQLRVMPVLDRFQIHSQCFQLRAEDL